MESPVRICIGAAVVVNVLLLCSTTSKVSALPQTTTTSTVKDDKVISSRYSKVNGTTWVPRGRTRNVDVALNELNPKESVSEERTEGKNAKYKDRGRVKFHSAVQTTTSSSVQKRLVRTSTEGPKITIITPTSEKMNISQIIDSMREYKKTKIPVTVTSTTPGNFEHVESDSEEEEEEYEDDDYIKDKEHEHHGPSNFHESNNFFTIPGFSDDDEFSHDSQKDNSVPKSYSVPSYDKFTSYFTKDGDDYSSPSESLKSNNYFHDFDSQLTTPRNDYFDKKFKEITNSIMTNLASIRKQTPSPNTTNANNPIKENIIVEKIPKGTPTNKSTVYFKNSKEIRILDNDGAGSDNKELSDVQGTSIYYEMSVLSTETYAIDNSNEDDCDNDTLPYEPTPSTPKEKEVASIKATQENLISYPTKDYISTTSNIKPPPLSSSTTETFTSTTFHTITEPATTERSTPKSYSSSYRNRNYSKRINFTNNRDNSNSVTVKTDQATSNPAYKPVTRKIHYTTPKIKPIWMAPRRNYTRPSYTRTTYPTTIYAEHFNVKNNTTPKLYNKTSFLTTVSSDIDPILQSDVGSSKKVVHSQSISDNSIPQLSKRGSVKFVSTTVASVETETETEKDNMEIPPTLSAWVALAGLGPPSSVPAPISNNSKQKIVDEDELQKVGELIESEDTTTSTTTRSNLNAEFTKNNIFDVDQNKLPWKPVDSSHSIETEIQTESSSIDTKPESLPAESNISVQSSEHSSTTETILDTTEMENIPITKVVHETTKSISWVNVNKGVEHTTTEVSAVLNSTKRNEIANVTRRTSFESITKLPSGITTPHSDDTLSPISDYTIRDTQTEPANTVQTTAEPDTFEITTIRFTYIPTILDDITETTKPTITTDVWHPVTEETTKATTIEDAPITTYRPKYLTSTEVVEEVSTNVPEITTEQETISKTETESVTPTTSATTVKPTLATTNETTTLSHVTTDATPELETTTIIVEVVTEINTEINIERETRRPTTTKSVQTTEEVTSAPTQSENPIDSSSEENSGSNEVITHVKETTTSGEPTATEEDEEDATTLSNSDIEPSNESQGEPTEKSEELTEPTATVSETTTTFQEVMRSSSESTSVREDIKVESTTDDMTTRSINDLEDVSSYGGDMTTEASSRVRDEAGSGAAVAIAVSTIGVIALILLVGLLMVVRKRGRRGMYAQRCTPVSLDAYSLDSVSVGHRKGNQRLRASKRSYGNPAYDDEVTSHPMQYAALASFALDVDSMTSEFAEIPSVTVGPDQVPAGCEDKNRYSNVLPLPETRVQLRRIAGDSTSEYINANYITGPGNIKNYYIACQAPLANTVADFWRMMWEQNSRLIVMLTEYMENGVEKCYEYLPPSEISDNKRTFGDFQVVLKKREQRDKYAVSSVQLVNLASRTWREVTHLWYFWPAKGVPEDYDSIIDFLSEMRSYMKVSQTAKEYDEQGVEVIYGSDSRSSFHNLSKLRSEDTGSTNGVNVYSPQRAEEQMKRSSVTNGTLSRMKAASEVEGMRACTVMCASGAGRAAAVIALDVCARALAAGAVDVPRVVRELRAQRPHSLANRHHYILLYKVLSEYGNKLMGGGVDAI